jgi:hypothetical protein
VKRVSFKNSCRAEIGLEAGGHVGHRRRERVLHQRKAEKGRDSYRDAPGWRSWTRLEAKVGVGGRRKAGRECEQLGSKSCMEK